MKKILSAAIALSLAASASAASAAPHDRYDRHDNRGHQSERHDRGDSHYERHASKRYKAGRYQPPRGYQARHWRHGDRLPASYRSRAYVVDYHRYGLQAPPRGYQYTRVDNDVVLTAIATGVIASVIVDMFQ